MTRCLIVDGYNIINSWPELRTYEGNSLEDSRDKLIEYLEDYRAYKGLRVVLVFDAHMVRGSTEKHEHRGGVEVVYTRENETADAYIEKIVDEVGKLHDILVATSDWLEQQVVMGRGAARISARELRAEVMRARKARIEGFQLRRSSEKHTIENRIGRDILEKLDKMRRGR